jgi:hypothetical protein
MITGYRWVCSFFVFWTGMGLFASFARVGVGLGWEELSAVTGMRRRLLLVVRGCARNAMG